jgi:hypothetical protein
VRCVIGAQGLHHLAKAGVLCLQLLVGFVKALVAGGNILQGTQQTQMLAAVSALGS